MPVVVLDAPSSLPTPGPIAIIRPAAAPPFVLSAGLTGVRALYGTPDPDVICFVEQFGRVVFLTVTDGSMRIVDDLQPVRIASAVDHGLLLVAGWQDITAIAADGSIRWQATNLVRDDLHITRSDGDRIYYRGRDFTPPGDLPGSIDTETGERV